MASLSGPPLTDLPPLPHTTKSVKVPHGWGPKYIVIIDIVKSNRPSVVFEPVGPYLYLPGAASNMLKKERVPWDPWGGPWDPWGGVPWDPWAWDP